MYVGAQDAQAGTGGIDGDIPNLNFIEFENTDIAAKTTYFTRVLPVFSWARASRRTTKTTAPKTNFKVRTSRARMASAPASTG